ncbi:mechanosensitive ion channel [Dactylosporangium aurantiacum]|uniref:Mechanosensitive ion channel n=1 Tax=Dactylosporangium aurantiacum TaxID=35754 RepID=A0A9Q9IP47_9ACTN|nr:mechanosensitive ion channel domain-containing protein [Dactylosporangium aurantiacum]UWZ58593.1 mechanosensitive ion channel [Dactylosporangium aurantiacum]
MGTFFELLRDTDSLVGRLVTTVVMIVLAVPVAVVAGRLVSRRSGDPYNRYYLRKAVHYGVAVVLVIALAVVWRPFAGRIGVVLGLAAAGVAFAMQDVIGAVAGWVSILTGRQFRVGDRVQMGGVHGDVLDISPLRTKILEIGSARSETSWVRGRQYTGRVVSVSNKAIFSEPVYNSTAALDYLWEELTVPVRHGDDWRLAERILREEAQWASSSQGAREAIEQMRRRYPVGRADVEPRVFVRITDDWVELAARFVVQVRNARAVKDDMSRRVLDRFVAEGIAVASATQEVTVRSEPDDGRS